MIHDTCPGIPDKCGRSGDSAALRGLRHQSGRGGIRTRDNWDMSPESYLCYTLLSMGRLMTCPDSEHPANACTEREVIKAEIHDILDRSTEHVVNPKLKHQ